MAVEITLVRHGESVANATGHWQGQSNSPLSREGRKQARALALRLARQRFDRIIASDLDRARETARALERPVVTDPTWREIDVGAWEGLTHATVATRFPEEVALLAGGRVDVKIGGGESWEDVRARALAALGALRASMAEGERALVVSHGGVLATLAAEVLGVFGQHPRPLGRMSNTALLVLRWEDGAASPRVVAYNDASHVMPHGPVVGERLDAGNMVIALVGEADTAAVQHLRAFHKRVRDWPAGQASGGAAAPEAGPFPWTPLLEAHRGEILALPIPTDAACSHVAAAVGLTSAALAPLTPGGYAHVVVGSSRTSLADYNQTAHLQPLPRR